jgi:hypothetical protein
MTLLLGLGTCLVSWSAKEGSWSWMVPPHHITGCHMPQQLTFPIVSSGWNATWAVCQNKTAQPPGRCAGPGSRDRHNLLKCTQLAQPSLEYGKHGQHEDQGESTFRFHLFWPSSNAKASRAALAWHGKCEETAVPLRHQPFTRELSCLPAAAVHRCHPAVHQFPR